MRATTLRRAGSLIIAVLALVFASTASANSKTVWHLTSLDAYASEIAGFPVEVNSSDSWPQWAYLVRPSDPLNVLGFTYLDADLRSTLSCINDIYENKCFYLYHRIWLSPRIYATFSGGLHGNAYEEAVALMTLDHEAQHQRLQSGDEGRVNACALADLPRLLAKWVSPTTQEYVTTPTTVRVKVRYRARVRVRAHGGWVIRLKWRYRYVNRVRNVTTLETVPNRSFTDVITEATNFRANQPYPYNSGTCF